MRNKDLVIKKLEQIEDLMVALERMVKTNQPTQEYLKRLERGKDLTQEVLAYVESTPRS